MMVNRLRIGQTFSGLYPVHGTMNVLRKVEGVIEAVGKGPNGKFVTVQENATGQYRSLSLRKIVQL